MITLSFINEIYATVAQSKYSKTTSSFSAQPVRVQIQLLQQVFKMSSFSFPQA